MIDAEQIILDAADEQGRVTPDLMHVRIQQWADEGGAARLGDGVLVVNYDEPMSAELLRSRLNLVREIVGPHVRFDLAVRGEVVAGSVPL
jgi:hypothetical protein